MSFLASTLSISTSLARGLSTSARASAPIKEFVVIGGGLMGAGIAQVMFDLEPKLYLLLSYMLIQLGSLPETGWSSDRAHRHARRHLGGGAQQI